MKTPDIETAVRFYYEKPELTNADIKELFGAGNNKVINMKKQVKKAMAEKGAKSWLPRSVNTKIAYEIWGMDIADYEERLNKIRRLKLERSD